MDFPFSPLIDWLIFLVFVQRFFIKFIDWLIDWLIEFDLVFSILFRYDGSQRLFSGSVHHEEAPASKADSIVRGLHAGRAHLHHHGVDDVREFAGSSTEPAGPPAETAHLGGHGQSNRGRHGLPRDAKLHSPGSRGAERPRGRRERSEDCRFRTGPAHPRGGT